MFDKIRERLREAEEKRLQEIEEEKDRLRSLSEKELMIEILMELRNLNKNCEKIDQDFLMNTHNRY